VLVWYVRDDGEVVSASGKIDITQCLGNPTSLRWLSDSTPPAPKDAAVVTISSSSKSVCGLGVVDRSVEILSRQQADRLTTPALFRIIDQASVSVWENSQINDYNYCYGKDNNYYYPVYGFEERSIYYGYNSGQYADAISSFNDAGLLVISDLTLETRPCRDYNDIYQDFYYAPGIAGGPEAATASGGGGGDIDSADADGATLTAEEKEEENMRTYFPETWLWDLIIVGDNGEGSQTVQLPDTITEWVGEAICVHPEKGLGISAPSTITTFTPFFLDITMPPVVRRGEDIPILVSIFNYLGGKLPVTVTLEESSKYTAKSYVQEACIEVQDKGVLEFVVTPSDVVDVNMTFRAVVNRADTQCSTSVSVDKSDTLIRSLKVKFEGVTTELTHSVFICSGDTPNTWSIATPSDIITDSERIFLGVTADLLGPTLENLGQLIKMPYGCGEQNMLNFAPNIYILQYLEASGQSTPDIKSKSLEYMLSGYQRELQYRHDDGSFSAFGENGYGKEDGSTMLTAFVLKSFAQAAKYITIDEDDLNKSKDWLLSLQNNDSGCFALKGMVHHMAMMGGLDGSLVTLTAYVVIALLESGKLKDTAPITSATNCITASSATDVYSNALKAYALALSNADNAKSHIDSAYNTITDNLSNIQKAILVEAAGYTLLAMVKEDQAVYVGQISTLAKLISGQRNGQGGFVSTQDTVVALQALATFSEKYPTSNTNLNLAVAAGSRSLSFSLTKENSLLLQTEYLKEKTPYNVTIEPSGSGCALVMLVQRYNVAEEPESTAFLMSVTSTSESCNSFSLELCAKYLLPSGRSNMALFEIELETGYSANKKDLADLVKKNSIKKYEEKDGVTYLYLDSVATSEQCLHFGINRDIEIVNALPGTVALYDYYEPDARITQKFKLNGQGC
ncbi:Seminal vesicle autoantigen (SVA), partial [Halocaridina rubra]